MLTGVINVKHSQLLACRRGHGGGTEGEARDGLVEACGRPRRPLPPLLLPPTSPGAGDGTAAANGHVCVPSTKTYTIL